MGKFIHIRSDKFPILPGEEEEVINEGMYGKALAEYLQEKLIQRGYVVPFVCAEDWGWWVELDTKPIGSGICIYAVPETSDQDEYICTNGFTKELKWSWSKFRFIDTRALEEKLDNDLTETFQTDPEIHVVRITDEFPL